MCLALALRMSVLISLNPECYRPIQIILIMDINVVGDNTNFTSATERRAATAFFPPGLFFMEAISDHRSYRPAHVCLPLAHSQPSELEFCSFSNWCRQPIVFQAFEACKIGSFGVLCTLPERWDPILRLQIFG